MLSMSPCHHIPDLGPLPWRSSNRALSNLETIAFSLRIRRFAIAARGLVGNCSLSSTSKCSGTLDVPALRARKRYVNALKAGMVTVRVHQRLSNRKVPSSGSDQFAMPGLLNKSEYAEVHTTKSAKCCDSVDAKCVRSESPSTPPAHVGTPDTTRSFAPTLHRCPPRERTETACPAPSGTERHGRRRGRSPPRGRPSRPARTRGRCRARTPWATRPPESRTLG